MMKYFFFLLVTVCPLWAAEVSNGIMPKGKAMTLVFEEDLALGSHIDEKNYLWTGLNIYVSVDSKGRMYVTDSDENRIQVFDVDGKYLKSIGGEGQGPGEFQKLSIFQVLDDDTGLGFENRQDSAIQSFDANHEFVVRKNIRTQGQDFLTARFSPDGTYFFAEFVVIDNEKGTLSYRSGVYERQKMALIKLFSKSTQPMPDFSKLLGNKNGIITFLSETMAANKIKGFTGFAADGRIYTAKSSEYKITLWKPNFSEKSLIITKEYRPIIKSDDEMLAIVEAMRDQLPFPPEAISAINVDMMRQAYEKAEIPLVKDPIIGLIPFEEGVLVVHDFHQLTGEASADIFDKDGVFIGSVTMPNLAMVGGVNLFGGNKVRLVFKGGMAYSIETRNDENVLVRYKYKLAPAN